MAGATEYNRNFSKNMKASRREDAKRVARHLPPSPSIQASLSIALDEREAKKCLLHAPLYQYVHAHVVVECRLC